MLTARTRPPAKKSNRVVRERQTTYRASSSRSDFKRVTRKQINAVVRKIVGEFDPEQVILFGSYAYGKPTIDSDVDLLVVLESKEHRARRALKILRRLLDVPFPIDLLVRTPQEIHNRLSKEDYFMREIFKQGRVLYAR